MDSYTSLCEVLFGLVYPQLVWEGHLLQAEVFW